MVPKVVADEALVRHFSPYEGESPVAAHIRADIEFRKEQGNLKYGTPLMTHNGRDALRDLYEELLDALLYATQYDMEQGKPDFEQSAFLDNIAVALDMVAGEILSKELGTPGILSRRKPEPKPKFTVEGPSRVKFSEDIFPYTPRWDILL